MFFFSKHQACKSCDTLKAENEYLRGLVDRLLDKAVGKELDDDAKDGLSSPPPPVIEKDEQGNVIAEHFTYGME